MDSSSRCGICHGDTRHSRSSGGSSQALFTAECSHQFHSSCVSVSGSVARGRPVCPLCGARWRDLPSFRSTNPSPPSPALAVPSSQPFFRPMEPRVFDDDDPVDRTVRSPAPRCGRGGNRRSGGAHHALRALGSLEGRVRRRLRRPRARQGSRGRRDGGGGARAAGPGGRARRERQHGGEQAGAPEAGHGLRHRQPRAPGPPLRRVLLLRREPPDAAGAHVGGREGPGAPRRGVPQGRGRHQHRGGPPPGRQGARRAHVPERRRQRRAPLGRAGHVHRAEGRRPRPRRQLRRARAAFLRARRHRQPVGARSHVWVRHGPRRGGDAHHRRGYGRHVLLHRGRGGDPGRVRAVHRRAPVRCRAGASCRRRVRVRAVKCGRYRSHVDADGRAASVDVGELYADEERRFLLFMHVSRARAADDTTHLLRVSCSYHDTATGWAKAVGGEDAVVPRPASAAAAERSVDVDRERVRVEATDGIAAARAAAERGAYAEAVEVLRSTQRSVARSAAARAGDSTCTALERELREMRSRVADWRRYELSGRAYVLAGLSSHAQQRATSRQMVARRGEASEEAHSVAMVTAGATTSYMTPAMLEMLDRSRRSRELLQHRQQQSTERRRTF